MYSVLQNVIHPLAHVRRLNKTLSVHSLRRQLFSGSKKNMKPSDHSVRRQLSKGQFEMFSGKFGLRADHGFEILHKTFDKWITLGNESVHFHGKFLFSWPYVWEEINWTLINTITQNVSERVNSRMPAEKIRVDQIQSSVIYAFYSCPAYWRHETSKETPVYAKLLLYSLVMHFAYVVDDLAEDEASKSHHSKFVESLGSLTNRILQDEFTNVEEIRFDESYKFIVSKSPDIGPYMELLHDYAEDLKNNFGITKDWMRHFARLTGRCFSMQTWCGLDDQRYLLNPYTQYHTRWFTGGIGIFHELVFLLEGIHIPMSVRENDHWTRCFEMATYLPIPVNDILGIQREFKEKSRGIRVDNAIFHYMDSTHCTFEQAVERVLREHNLILQEFHHFLQWSKTNRDYLYDLNEVERDIFQRSTALLGECVGCTLQAQALMSRYNAGLEFTFEMSDSVYAVGSTQNQTQKVPQLGFK